MRNRQRRNNIHIIGWPEQENQGNLVYLIF